MPHASDPRLLALHGLRLKGFAEAAVVAAFADLPEAEVVGHLQQAASDGYAVHREGRLTGWTLTPAGRAENERLLAHEVDAVDARDDIDSAYRRFLELNAEMLVVCTRWQVRDIAGVQALNDHADPAYDQAVLADLAALDQAVQPVCEELGQLLERFAAYGARFSHALGKVRAGGREWFTKPIIESYHTVWFELHEDLLATLGIDRASEVSH